MCLVVQLWLMTPLFVAAMQPSARLAIAPWSLDIECASNLRTVLAHVHTMYMFAAIHTSHRIMRRSPYANSI